MHPVLFSFYGVEIRVWGILVGLAVCSGLWLAVRLAKGSEFDEETLQHYLLYAVAVGFIGARLWEAAFSWGEYAADPLRVLRLWEGGLSIQGAVAANVVFACRYFSRRRLSVWRFADIAAPGLILGQAIGRIGCFFNGDAYGQPTDAWYGVSYQPGTPAYQAWGAQPLFPAELLEAGLDLAILAVLLFLFRRKRFDGEVGLAYFILYSLARFALEFLRGDSLLAGDFKAAQLTALLTAAGAVVCWLRRRAAIRPL